MVYLWKINAPSALQITSDKADDNNLTDLKKEDFCGEVVIASVPSASSRTLILRTNSNKIECLYQYAVKHGLDPEKFLIVTEANKKR
ncbi:9440_t:CDS:2 [Funneliformis mosseae]|uniref:9440_t:CDS:1 n=1 Tax=Funneliformis mosseae TaxID=27381 RepID=A0A9N9GUP7_FUNMO|nr:9440_t:CDS:2 [Funneliformis mosseae]